MIFIRHPFVCGFKYIENESSSVDENTIRNTVESYYGYTDFTLVYNGRKLHEEEVVPDNSTIHVIFSLPGGKGGFGSMLRAIGAQIEKTTNREACRDLSGRRLRDINEEQRLKKWIAKEAEREAEKKKRRQARIERLKSRPTHKFFDFEFEKEISELPERVNDALSEGLQKAKQPMKRPCEAAGSSESRKKKSWLADEFLTSSSDSDPELNAMEGDSPSKKIKIATKDSSSYESSSEISDLSQPGPSSFIAPSYIDVDESSTNNSEYSTTEGQVDTEQSKDGTSNSVKADIRYESIEEMNNNKREISIEDLNSMEEKKSEFTVKKDTKHLTVTDKFQIKSTTEIKEPNIVDDSPINLLQFQSASELETLGLNKLKSELMSRGLKCGGSVSDRAQRLWKICGLQPHEYPTNLLAKNKK